MNGELASRAAELVAAVGPASARSLVEQWLSDPSAVPGALAALGDDVGAAAAVLLGAAAGYEHRAARVRVETVWTGPGVHDVPVRATEPVLLELVGAARAELIIATYAAKPLPALLAALRSAVDRAVDVWIVVETLHGAGSALQGEQPAAAFAALGVPLWSWDVTVRPEGAKMHAKLAVADSRALLVGSANLTGSGLAANLEAGVLVRGGSAPQRAAEHLRALRRDGVITRI